MAYRIALFDADNTLLDFTRAEAEAIRLCLTTHGIPADEATVALYSRVNDRHWKRLEQGLTTRERLRWNDFGIFWPRRGTPPILAAWRRTTYPPFRSNAF
jgi:FMN phosphatase YigB (HAD superfamily)